MSEKYKNFLTDLVVGALVTALVCWLDAGRGYPVLHCLCDGFFVTAAMLLGVGGLRAIRNKGTFDVAGFGLRSALHVAFPFLRGEKEEDIYEYCQRKAEKRKGAGGLLAAGTVYLVLSVITLCLYYADHS